MADEEQQSQESINSKYSPYSPPMQKFGSSIETLTNPSNALYKFELFLRCLREGEDGVLVKIGGDDWQPLLNEQGINAVMAAVESVVHNMNALSNFTNEGIDLLYNSLKENIIEILIFNRETYNISKKHRDLIVGNCLRFAYGFMMRAYEEGDKKFWKGSVVETRHTQDISKQRAGFSLNPFDWGKKGG